MKHWVIKTAFSRAAVAIICGLLQGICNAGNAREPTVVGNITKQRLLNVGSEPGAWLTGGRDYQQSYYSPLADITRKNIKQLGFAWEYEVDFVAQLEATPVVVDGVMFTSGNKGAVFALDAKTGSPRWTFFPEVNPDIARKSCCGLSNRGVAVWRGKVYVGSIDGYLYALDAATGALLWRADTIFDRSRAYSITGAPYIAGNVVVIGNGGAEFDARGYVTAYDLDTGRQTWRFFTVPGDPAKSFEHPELEMAAKSWDPNSRWDVGLGGTAWDGMAYDPKLNLLFVGTGNATPYPRHLRSPAGGDNLFVSCILAINPQTGRLVWHYQTTPGDSWDYTATQKIILADITVKGKKRKVLMQAPKNGFFYVLDRENGQLLSADPYAIVTWATHVDPQTGRPVETAQSDYSKEPKLIFPSENGAHNWHPMAYNLKTGLVYIPVKDTAAIFAVNAPFDYRPAQRNIYAHHIWPIRGPYGLDGEVAKEFPPIEVLAAGQPDYTPRSFVRAWDPLKQQKVWELETTGGNVLGTLNTGGLMTTASGLLFQGREDGTFNVLDAKTGAQLHAIDVGNSMVAAPMTYRIDGKQYVAIMAGASVGSKKGRIVAFKLGGSAVPKPPLVDQGEVRNPVPTARSLGTREQHVRGAQLFENNCTVCHSSLVRAPDLTKMSQQTQKEFLDIVLRGTRADKGMGNFSAVLSEQDAQAIHVYLANLAWENYWKSTENISPDSHRK